MYEVRTGPRGASPLRMPELILYRRDFRHLVVFAAPDGKVTHSHRLASSLDAAM